MSFTTTHETRGGQDHVTLSGTLDATAATTLAQLAQKLQAAACTFDFKAVTLVNSHGAAAWVRFLKALPPGRALAYERCPAHVVDQINMLPTFRADAEILSVLAPYVCDACDTQDELLLVKGVNMPPPGTEEAPEHPCPQCKAPMELEVFASKFFMFLRGSSSP